MPDRVRLRFFNQLFGAEETRRHITQSGSDETSSCSGSTVDVASTHALGLTCDQIGALLFGLETLFTIQDRLKRQNLQTEAYHQAALDMAHTLFECISRKSRAESYETMCETLLQGTAVVRTNRALVASIARVVAKRVEKRIIDETHGEKGTLFSLAVARVNELASLQGVAIPSAVLRSLHLLQSGLSITELGVLRNATLLSLQPHNLLRPTAAFYAKATNGFTVTRTHTAGLLC